MGLPYDGVTDSCSSTGNYIMAATSSLANILNMQRFSACSVLKMKANLLNTNLK